MAPALYGSSLPCNFVRDAISGANSLDVVVIGDSNTNYTANGAGNGGGGGGWYRNFARALQNKGAAVYGSQWTPAMQSAVSGGSVNINATREDSGTITTPFGFYQNVQPTTTTLLSGINAGAVTTAYTNALAPSSLLFPYGLSNSAGTYTATGWDYAYIAAATTSNTFGQIYTTSPGGGVPNPALPSWVAPGTAGVRHRTVYATNATSAGTIRPTIYNIDWTSGSAVYTLNAQGSVTTLNASGVTVQAADVSFTMPPTANYGLITGWNYVGNTSGPAAVLMESIYRQRIGISAHSLHTHPGGTSTQIATAINNSNTGRTFLENYFTQVVNRQKAGTSALGRVLVVVNFGLNGGGDTGATWTANATTVVNKIQAAWASAGLPSDALGFLCTVSHPVLSGGAIETNMIDARRAANAWAATQSNVVVADLSQIYSGAQLNTSGWYATAGYPGEAHLKQAGYLAYSEEIVARMAASV